ncbi:Gfo/Idh/MocA family oxidoreductase [Nocardiopsis lambiniae]|uniref:Gfo/Idh/MocA family oxidoreductase n=1 Tax=Nocardiopsis lambiniae TaxID=3075539 RepID=A0ABU2MCH4_9ACTN|nr:Gfo/Idh/MocA family oxidoreductase [Nocardiopsis sp. DSM 44743]MDT0330265.1 Gfo/Idh/MocA family oxidoreductase [Nocardiopsis sp. DSM 44743]
MNHTTQRRYAIVGTGSRARMYTRALTGGHRRHGALVALCDTNATRMAVHNRIVTEAGLDPVPTHHADDFARMLVERAVDEVIVCTVDHTHADYIVTALEHGADVITEKPMTTDLEGLRRIEEARERTGGRVTVGFNYRYNPVHRKVRELIAEGAVGEVGSVHFEWLLDLRHGADYFRRWHRDKTRSGGLLVHKASHHFDLVNWWIGARPDEVFASGRLFFYGEENGRRHGVAADYERGHGADTAQDDPFALHLADSPDLTALYLDAEHEDGYRRDLNVFGPGITIEDDMSVLVRYDTGARLTYHLTAYAPWEGYRLTITGSRGRLELDMVEFDRTTPGRDETNPVRGMPAPKEDTVSRLLLRRHWQAPQEISVEVGEGGHGGGDTAMLDALLGRVDDGIRPDHADGGNALLTGLAANASMASGAPVRVADLRAGKTG